MVMDIGRVVCLNGEYLSAAEAAVPAGDGAVLYGMGLFETIKVSGGRPVVPERHLARLFRSAGELGLSVPFGPGKLEEMVYETAAKNKMEGGGLRMTLTAGEGGSGPSVVIRARTNPYVDENYIKGVSAVFAGHRRNETSPLVRHKTLNYWENILARRAAMEGGYSEALFINISGNLAEGSASNIFIISGGRVSTPDVESGLLPGITRQRVIEACRDMDLQAEERKVRPEELAGADEAFLTSALMGVMPLVRIGGENIGGGVPGKVTRLIMENGVFCRPRGGK